MKQIHWAWCAKIRHVIECWKKYISYEHLYLLFTSRELALLCHPLFLRFSPLLVHGDVSTQCWEGKCFVVHAQMCRCSSKECVGRGAGWF